MEFSSLYVYFSVIYIVGIFIYIAERTYEKTEFHRDGFLGAPCSTNSYRKPTGKDVRVALIWPILLIPWIVKCCIWILNEVLAFVLLIFNYNYKRSNIYKFINDKVY